MSIIGKIIGGVAGPVVDYLNERQKLRSAERLRKAELADATHKRQVDLITQGLAADATWEIESLRAHAGGWKDEFVLIVLATPLIMCFIPGLDVYVHRGFAALDKTPWWYPVATLSVFLATYGIRWYRRQISDT